MVAMRVLMLVEDTRSVVEAAASVSLAMSPSPKPPVQSAAGPLKLSKLPKEMRLDANFLPVPLLGDSAAQSLSAAGLFAMAPGPKTLGSDAYVVRGTIDAGDLDAITKSTSGPGGEPRIFADPGIASSPVTCGGTPPVGNATDVERLLQVGRLRRLGMDGEGVALAIVDNGINLDHLRSRGLLPRLNFHASWTPQVAVRPGAAPVDHGTMCAYDALLSAPNATLLDYAILRSTRRGGSVMDGVLSDAVQAYGVLLRLMMLPEEERFFHSLVVSNSWGMFHPDWDFPAGHPGRYFDNPLHPFNRIVGSLAHVGADILFAAGNCGPTCPDGRCLPIPTNQADRRISGANSHPDVLTVAGVDTQRNLVGYSSHGPGALSHDKPDLAGYTHFLGSEAFGVGQPDSGTSTACPLVAGVVAALRSAYPYVSGNINRQPAQIRFYLQQTATKTGPAGWDAQFGHGLIDCAQFDMAGTVLK